MHYLSLLTTTDLFVIGALVLVLACGAYDHWLQH